MALAEMTVMVVEDHGFQRRMAVRLLNELGVQRVADAADGDQALQQLTAAAATDLVLVDLDLPGMDGVQFIDQVAQRGLAKAVALVSALDPGLLHSVQSIARGYGLRVLGSIEKPLTAGKLQDLLERFGRLDEHELAAQGVEVEVEALRAALDAGTIQPWFQPQVTFTNGQVVAVEALARWPHPEQGLIYPAQFIAVAEREGLIDRLTEQLLRQACDWKRRWAQRGLHLKLSLNLSVHSLGSLHTADRLQAWVREAGVDPREVVLELGEAAIMDQAAACLPVLARLRLKGFGLSIDDFGTGYSSLAQLTKIPFTELKIDRSFITGAAQSTRRRAVVEASLDLARKLNLGVVAEGIESTEEWQWLAELGCTYAQGFLIGKAVPGDELTDAIARWRRPEL